MDLEALQPEADRENHDLARGQLLVLARRKTARKVQWTPEQPTEWRPREVTNPESGLPFTEPSAWELIASLLESGHPLEEVVLRQPPGKKAYVMLVDLGPTCPALYIKLQLGNGKVICRSFHYSVRSESPRHKGEKPGE